MLAPQTASHSGSSQSLVSLALGAADSHGQRIRSIRSRLSALQRQDDLNHPSNLLFGSPAVSCHCGLDFGRGVLVDLDLMPGEYSEQSSTGLSQDDQRTGIETVKGGFQRRGRRLPVL